MASSKLIPLSSFPLQTLLPSRKSPTPRQVHLHPFQNPSTVLKTTQLPMIQVSLPKITPKTSIKEERESLNHHHLYEGCSDSLSVVFPSLKFSNTFFFKSAYYNIQVTVDEHEHEESLVNKFRRDVLRAGVLQECKRRRFFECSQEKRKRKAREAAKRNRKRRPPPKVPREDKAHASKKKEDFDNDNWEFLDIDLPYVR